ncbi:MAG TPA: hypothetical protein VMZ53_28220 [Kofleriaceae bacterium]|nr:hypothetical protein [Kofleriaceae bacterium]
MGRVEVVVRFAGDLLDVIQLPAGETCFVGTTAVRAVAGTELTIGLVTVSVTRALADQERLRRPRIEVRPFIYGAVSLVAQVALLVVAFWTASPEPTTAPAVEADSGKKPGAVRIKRFATPSQTIERTPDPAPSETPVTADETPEQIVERDTPAPQEVQEFVPSEMTGGGLATTGPSDGDGTSKFDPAANPAFDSIKVGNYSTLSSGRAAGDGYGPEARNSSLVVITCDRASCLVLGGEKAARVRKAVNERIADITDCYKRAAANGGGSVEIDFQVDAAGDVGDLEIGEADPAGSCVAKILRSLQIDAADETTASST